MSAAEICSAFLHTHIKQSRVTKSIDVVSWAAFPFKFRWWCHVDSGPTVTGKTCQVILESHSFEKIKRIKNRTQFCPNGKASNGRPCSNSVWTKSPWARISSAVCPPANEQHRKPLLFFFFLVFLGLVSKLWRFVGDLSWNRAPRGSLLKTTALWLHHDALRLIFTRT